MRGSRGGGRGGGGGGRGSAPHLKNHKNIGFLSNIARIAGSAPLKNTKATKLAFNVGPTSIDTPAKRHLNGVSLVGR